MIFQKAYVLVILFLVGCASNPLSETLDDWSNQKDDDYWYGTAIISKKNFKGENIHQAAHSQAISNIASQIKVSISNDFQWVIKEENYKIDDYSIQILNTRVDNNIEDIEIVDFKNLKESYVLFAKLSKQKFYTSIKRKSESAIAIAKEYIEKSLEPSLLSFENLANAEKLILPYIDYSVRTNIGGVDVNLYSFIQNLRNDLISRIMIKPDSEIVYVKKLFSNKNQIDIRVYDNQSDDLLSNIPLIININNSSTKCLTNQYGECGFIIDTQSLGDDKNQYVKINLDREGLIPGNNSYDFNVDSQVLLEIVPTNIYIDVQEYNLNSKMDHTYIDSVVKEFLIKNFAVNFVNNIDGSDISITVYATTRKNGNDKNEYGLYQTYSDASITVKSNGSYVTDLSINDIKGADFRSFKQAGNKSLEKISKQIAKNTLPKLVDILNQINQ